jgi:hypothetical protein
VWGGSEQYVSINYIRSVCVRYSLVIVKIVILILVVVSIIISYCVLVIYLSMYYVFSSSPLLGMVGQTFCC